MPTKNPPGELQKTEVASVLVPEILEALKGESGAQININILLQQVAEKAESPSLALQHADKVISLSERYEEHRLKTFQARTRAIIDVKTNDPDEIEKRSNNRVRRLLKIVLAFTAVSSLVGMLASILTGGTIVVTGLLAAIGAMSIAMLGPLASGESVSSNDVVRMIGAVGEVVSKTNYNGRTGQRQGKRK